MMKWKGLRIGLPVEEKNKAPAEEGKGANAKWRKINAVKLRIGLTACLLLVFVAWCIVFAHAKYQEGAYFLGSVFVFIGLGAMTLHFVFVHMLYYDPSNSHTLKSLLFQYGLTVTIHIIGRISWKIFVKASKNPVTTQHQLLMKYIKTNAKTEWGTKYGFSEIKNREEFKKSQPLMKYDHYSPYVQRIMSGEKNILTEEDAVFMAMTSGTTANPKIFPVVKSHKKRAMWTVFAILYKFRSVLDLGRTQDFRCYPKPRAKTLGGLDMGGITLHLFTPLPHHITNPVYKKLYTEKAAFYAHAIHMLAERDMRTIQGYSSNLLYSFFKFIELNIDTICKDIARGEISEGFGISEEIREEINQNLSPDPERARAIKKEFSKGITKVAKRVWPRLSSVTCTKTGGFHNCAKLLEKSYLQGVKLYGLLHVATEGNIGAMFEDDLDGTTFTFLPHSCFYEFIPEEQIVESQPETLFLDQIEKGKRYEIVVTNENGLYRCRLGDVIQVTGFYNNTPSYSFEHRTGQMLSIALERTPESVIYRSIETMLKQFPNSSLIDYTSTESFNIDSITENRSAENRYLFYIEFDRILDVKSMEKYLDDCVCEQFVPYKVYRERGSITQLKIKMVKLGTFDELKGQIMGQFTNSQFKQPRVIRNEEYLRFLSKQVIQS